MDKIGLNGQNFCETAGLTEQAFEKCFLLDSAGKAFTHTQGLGNAVGVLACRAAHQIPVATHTVNGQAIDVTLTDQRPLPSSFNTSILSAEGGAYYYWWTEVFNFGIAASCAATSNPHTVIMGAMQLNNPAHTWRVAPSWTVHSVLWSNANMDSNSPQQLYIPLAAITYNNDTLAIVIRGTETYNDWQTDFTYSQVAFSGPVSWPGRTHEGFSRLAAYLWSSGVQAAIDSLVLQQGSSTAIQHVVVAGHSMGAGVGTLLAYTIQTYLERNRSQVRVDAMLFAPPNVGDSSFADAFGAVVNGRRIPFESDIVPQLPCSPTVTACVRVPWLGGAPMLALGVWTYASVPGTVALTAAGMPMENRAWANFKSMYACQMGRYVLATHVCAYQCYLSQYVAGGAATNMCRLWNTHEGGAAGGGQDNPQTQGSFCYSYPVADGRQYPYESASGILSLFT